MNVLDLFSGIGGFTLGLDRVGGFRTVAFCEIDPFCRRVLNRHWPYVPIFDDVQNLSATDIGERIDVICGGFPCQDISSAGNRIGITGERSGLWGQYARLIGELRPRYVIVENVADLLYRGLGDVLGALAALGYDAEWDCIPASAVGAPHRRDRLWLVAYPHAHGERQPRRPQCDFGTVESELEASRRDDAVRLRMDVADASIKRCVVDWREQFQTRSGKEGQLHQWSVEPDVGRVADGIPARTHRLRCLGNAVVPEIPYRIGKAIMKYEAANA